MIHYHSVVMSPALMAIEIKKENYLLVFGFDILPLNVTVGDTRNQEPCPITTMNKVETNLINLN